MRSVMIMFDSLNRRMLEPYGCDWTATPNFTRLARRAATFQNSYVCSMPCMPARRDLHTGRPNFLHRSWGPLEPYDDSVPEILRDAGVHTHLVTDHQHYWEDGGGNYHTRYKTFDFIRGQEGDPWIGQVKKPPPPDREIVGGELSRQDAVNREVTSNPEDFPMSVTFRKGAEFIRRNQDEDRWMLQIETFDPHEPFFSLEEDRLGYREHFDHYRGKPVEWPPYREVRETPEVVEHARFEYAALLHACDARLGDILDLFDELNLWKDTQLIVWTDHGFLLGEHHAWGKCWLPFYQEVAHTPFFLWDPRSPQAAGQRRSALVQPSLDLGPTLLDFFGLEPTAAMLGRNLSGCVASDESVRNYALFGIFGGHVNITDGRYVYFRGPQDDEKHDLFEYALMPTRMRRRFTPDELKPAELAPAFSFTKECPLLKIRAPYGPKHGVPLTKRLPSLLFDLTGDYGQLHPIADAREEDRLSMALAALMREMDAPPEQFERLGLVR